MPRLTARVPILLLVGVHSGSDAGDGASPAEVEVEAIAEADEVSAARDGRPE